jgi:hypothetical protein
VDPGEDCDDGRNGDPDDGCRDDCTYTCTEPADCDDGDDCNGTESCDTGMHTCTAGTPLADGTVCETSPRSICLDGSCVESVCGDGYIDTGAGESCDPPVSGECSDTCHTLCTGDGDCDDDANMCNGDEYCNLGTGECDHRNAPPDGEVCSTDPRQICLAGTCQDSQCGDEFTDAGAGEVCDDGRNGDPDDGCRDDCTFTCLAASQDTDCDDAMACTLNVCEESTHTCSNPVITDTGVVCRASAGACDVAETCDGTNAACPADTVLSAGTECRAQAGPCDPAETCDGVTGTCPTDALAPAGTPCDDSDDCTMLDVCDAGGACAGTTECTQSPITGTGTDTRLGICVTDAGCDTAVGGPGCTTTHALHIKSSWDTWDTGTDSPMTFCDTYWAYTSPALASGTEHCYTFYHPQSATWFYAEQGSPAVCGADHCGHDSCGYTP